LRPSVSAEQIVAKHEGLREMRRSALGWRLTGAHIKSEHRFVVLDGMRGVAAAAIVVRHCPALFGTLTIPNSQLAVDLFFLLSGFVLAVAYEQRLLHDLTARRFLLVRLIRLYPLYALGTALGLVVAVGAALAHRPEALSWPVLAGAVIPAAVMLPSVVTPALFPLDSPAWSLFFELVANWSYGLLGAGRRISTKALFVIVPACGLVFMLCAVALGGVGAGADWPMAITAMPRVGFSFFAGVLLYRAPRPAMAVPAWAVMAFLLALLWIAPGGWVEPVYQLAVVIVAFPLLVWTAACLAAPAGRKVYLFLGAVSYGAYALHKPVENLLAGIAAVMHWTIPTPWSGVAFLALLAGAVWALEAVYDKPARRWLLRLSGGRFTG
jgi:peptidoglycan/LPS O-acetylase OafA/YrhL